jgi:hypothetical protein
VFVARICGGNPPMVVVGSENNWAVNSFLLEGSNTPFSYSHHRTGGILVSSILAVN